MNPNSNEHHQTTERVAGKAHESVESAAENVVENTAKAEEYAREQAAYADDALNRAFSYVGKNPLISIVAAFAGGLLISFLTSHQ